MKNNLMQKFNSSLVGEHQEGKFNGKHNRRLLQELIRALPMRGSNMDGANEQS